MLAESGLTANDYVLGLIKADVHQQEAEAPAEQLRRQAEPERASPDLPAQDSQNVPGG